MKEVIFDAVVDVRYLADIKLVVSQFEVFPQLSPSIDHRLNGLIPVQWTFREERSFDTVETVVSPNQGHW